jgi:hypothetical protein
MRALLKIFVLLALYLMPTQGWAQDFQKLSACKENELKCILDYTKSNLFEISDKNWRDQIARDLVMRYADSGLKEDALSLINKIQNPDKKAMAIRAAGFGLAKFSNSSSKESDKIYFEQLDEIAKTISHDGARAIAYTYIAMGQALAHLDEDATKTALEMNNSALRNKALAESAEIQAERGDLKAANKSISYIDELAFKDKAYSITAEIFIKQQQYNEALLMADHIQNVYKKSKVLLKLTEAQINARESKNNIK